MNAIVRKACVRWKGGPRDGRGAMTTGSGALKQARYSLGVPLTHSVGTNPAELIAAAHAGSFSLALSDELHRVGFVSGDIATTATVTLERLAAGWTLTNMNLDVIAIVPRATQGDFIDATVRARMSCPITRLLRTSISMNAKLEMRGAPRHPYRSRRQSS